MNLEPVSSFQYPPGIRFHPSDEELIIHYLQNRVNSRPLPASVIAEVELYNYNPWELPKKAVFGEDEWYFFSPRDRKYPNGERPNRTAGWGYWKATGIDKPILASSGSGKIGVKKGLVFYTGRPTKGAKTNWVMDEYRLLHVSHPRKLRGSMRLDDWVLCRVRQKGNKSNKIWAMEVSPDKDLMGDFPKIKEPPSVHAYTNPGIITDFGNMGCQVLASILRGEPVHLMENISSEIFQSSNHGNNGSSHNEDHSEENSPLPYSFPEAIFNALNAQSI